MKAVAISAIALGLLQFAAAQPHGRAMHKHEERAATKEVLVVYENGKPVKTITTTTGGATPAPAAPAPAAQDKAAAKPKTSAAAPASSSSSSSSSSGSGSSGTGISYSPYQANGGCKGAGDVSSDLQTIKKAGYQLVRIYGTDCNQVANVYSAAKKEGLKMFVGMANQNVISGGGQNTNGIQSDCKAIASGVQNDWSIIDTVAVGNEIVNGGLANAGTVTSAVKTAKSGLSSAGYKGPVVAVDTFIAIYNNQGLCNAGDYIAANAHPFFDGNVKASGAGQWVEQQYQKLSSQCGKKVVITETGWPTQGGNNGAAVPSKQNQATVVSGIKSAFSKNPSNLIMFTAFNDLWKQDTAATKGCEKYWGMLN